MKHPQRMYRTPMADLVNEKLKLERELQERRHHGNGVRQAHNRLRAIRKAISVKESRARRGLPIN